MAVAVPGGGARRAASLAGAVVASLLLTCAAGCGADPPAGHPTNAKGADTRCTVPASAAAPSVTSTAAWTPSGDGGGSGSPFVLNLGGGAEYGPVGVQAGQPVPLAIFVSHASAQPDGAQPNKDALSAPLPLRVCIYAAQEGHLNGVTRWVETGAPLWVFTPPALTPAQSAAANKISFSWHTIEANGNPLPPGVYFAQLAFPPTVPYVADGRTHSEALPTQSDIADQQYFTLPIFLGGPNPQPPMSPKIRALASLWDKTIYVPTTLPGNPRVTVSTVAPPPGMPRAEIGIMDWGTTHPAPGLSRAIYQATEVIPLGTSPTKGSDTPAVIAKAEPNSKLIHVTVAGVATPIPAVVSGSKGSYDLSFNMGNVGMQFQATGTETQVVAASQDWTPVLPVEPS